MRRLLPAFFAAAVMPLTAPAQMSGVDMSLPMNMLVAKEISLRGSFRFHPEFAQAVSLINDRSR